MQFENNHPRVCQSVYSRIIGIFDRLISCVIYWLDKNRLPFFCSKISNLLVGCGVKYC